MKVNSFHKYKIVDHNNILNVIASFKDSIEIATYKKYNFLGLMFHPERKNYDQIKVNLLIKKFLLKQL
jgi:gamma-glutamyl-gamma-aminobutyrate hydrolase PuuD